jgi:hypothetical protein
MEWVVDFTPRLLYPQGKSPWYPLDRRLGRPQSRSGRGEEKNSQPLPRLEPPIIQPVAQRYTTETSRLLQGQKEMDSKCQRSKDWQGKMEELRGDTYPIASHLTWHPTRTGLGMSVVFRRGKLAEIWLPETTGQSVLLYTGQFWGGGHAINRRNYVWDCTRAINGMPSSWLHIFNLLNI